MTRNQLEKMLQQEAPPPDPVARLAARRAALEEFARMNSAAANESAGKRAGLFQALLARLRPSREPSRGADSVPWYSRQVLVGSAASIGIAVIGVAVVWNTLQQDPKITDFSDTEVVPPIETGMVEELQSDAAPAHAEAASPAAQESANARSPASADADADAGAGTAQPARAQAMDSRRDANAASTLRARPEQKADAKPGDITHSSSAENMAALSGADANAAAAPAAAPASPDDEQAESVVVTGRRGSMKSAQEVKREATPIDVVSAEDIGATEEMASISKARGTPPHKGALSYPADVRAGALIPQNESERPTEGEGRDMFEQFEQNPVKRPAVQGEEVSTFSADVDTSSYSFVRKQLNQGVLPQKDAVRAEEMVNYFDYAWPAAESRERPFRPTVVVSDSPWGKGRKLIHIGIKGYELPARERPDANLVMLIDVSGSMNQPDKLPLVKQSMKLMLASLKPTDTVSIAVYADAEGMVLPPTPASDREKIAAALDSLTPGGSTAGAAGISLAYELAEKSFRKDGVNRILLCTDGDFNVGIDSTNQLKGFVERKREKGVFLSVLGFGQGNYRDELAQALAQNGNGVAAYIDTLNEAQKVLVQEAGASLFTIAKDVKLQVEFNPATVAEYRLVGYETRALKREDFNNDAVDAGDVGAGHAVTAIYEITPVDAEARLIGETRYGKKPETAATPGTANEYGFLQIKYKLPRDKNSQLIHQPINIESGRVSEAVQRDVQFSTAVAGFAQLLRGGQYTGSLTYDDVIRQALAARGEDPYGYRNEFVQLVRRAQVARGM